MQGQDQAVDLEHDLVRVGIGPQVAADLGLHDGAEQRLQPGLHRAGQGIAHRAGPVIKLDGAAYEDSAGLNFHRHALHPVAKQRLHPWQTAFGLQGWVKNFLLEAAEIFADDRDLQLFA